MNYRWAKWALYLSRFNFTFKYVPRSKIDKVDSLSRRLDWEIEVEKDNENEMLVKPEWLKVRKIKVVEIIIEGINLLKKIKQFRVQDNKVVKIVEEMK